jgi:hypothetical protein
VYRDQTATETGIEPPDANDKVSVHNYYPYVKIMPILKPISETSRTKLFAQWHLNFRPATSGFPKVQRLKVAEHIRAEEVGRLTVALEVATSVDRLELGYGSARGGDVGRLQLRALDESRRAAGVRAEEIGVGDDPERSVVLHDAALGVPPGPSPGGGGERLGNDEGRLELPRLLARERHADLGVGALELAPRASHRRRLGGGG